MVEENINEQELEGDGVPKYEEMVTLEPEREIKLDSYTPVSKTIDEEEEQSEHVTDKVAILRMLHPKYKDPYLNELARSARTSRIFPDNFTDKHFLLSASYIEEHIDEKDLNVTGVISMIQDFLSVGFEGRGIADLEELAGAETSEELDKLSKSLGL